jgi:hypothetical protein
MCNSRALPFGNYNRVMLSSILDKLREANEGGWRAAAFRTNKSGTGYFMARPVNERQADLNGSHPRTQPGGTCTHFPCICYFPSCLSTLGQDIARGRIKAASVRLTCECVTSSEPRTLQQIISRRLHSNSVNAEDK